MTIAHSGLSLAHYIIKRLIIVLRVLAYIYNMITIQQLSKVERLLKDWDNDDDNLEKLENAMDYFCGNWDISEGFKHAILLTIKDQYNNHNDETDGSDVDKLIEILEG